MNVALRTPASECEFPPRPRLIQVARALDEILAGVTPVSGSMILPVNQARGRVAAGPIVSTMPLPRFDNSAMDGYGIHGEDLAGARPLRLRHTERIAAGSDRIAALGAGTTVQILTGAPVPPGVGAVAAHEQTRRDGKDIIVDGPLQLGANIRRAGEDVAVGQQLVSSGTRIDVRHVALLQATGVFEMAVKSRLHVGVLSNGNELVEAGEVVKGHNIIDTNRPFLLNLLNSPDVELRDYGIARDCLEDVSQRVQQAAADCDLLVTTGGICGSDADHVASAIRAAGGTCGQIKLALRPGKPIGVGRIGSMHILCLPGNPLSALVTTVLFVRPLLRALAGSPRLGSSGTPAVAADIFRHAPGRAEFVPAVVESIDAAGPRRLTSLPRGSHRLSSLAAADGFAEIPRDSGDVLPGEPLIFHSFAADFSV